VLVVGVLAQRDKQISHGAFGGRQVDGRAAAHEAQRRALVMGCSDYGHTGGPF
jgi:hypothetical protein